ncbi:hypothetical protein MXMO3_00023 [Maritalea myrionectae]|uniref:Uncharacterized protein n=1 Tax=Maritalea myrionectae TaxID=454601 RepID=A0A2R4M979_9HYPH|nr:hypothetical protein [Maritalea myrionectae]AVX02571.1 hypothetical protein MXMO3_00023 [Maritalea myrionectae]
MRELVNLSSSARRLMMLATKGLGLDPIHNYKNSLGFRLDYQSGLILHVGIIEVVDQKLFIFKKRQLMLVVSRSNEKMALIETLWSEGLNVPKSEFDISFVTYFANKFVAASRTCADIEGAGLCYSTGAKTV